MSNTVVVSPRGALSPEAANGLKRFDMSSPQPETLDGLVSPKFEGIFKGLKPVTVRETKRGNILMGRASRDHLV